MTPRYHAPLHETPTAAPPRVLRTPARASSCSVSHSSSQSWTLRARWSAKFKAAVGPVDVTGGRSVPSTFWTRRARPLATLCGVGAFVKNGTGRHVLPPEIFASIATLAYHERV